MDESSSYKLGRLVGKKFRKAKWIWESFVGSEEESIRAEYGVGCTMTEAIFEQTLRDTDPKLQEFLEEIRCLLAKSVSNRLHRFKVMVVVEDTPTAFALPGGFIFVTRSLVEFCDNDRDEMAFVIAHEMAHVIRRHAINRVLTETALSAATLASPSRGLFVSWFRRVGLQALERAHSREQEFEADMLGVLLARNAGFDPAGAVRLFERFLRLSSNRSTAGLGSYFETHPDVSERILKLRELVFHPKEPVKS